MSESRARPMPNESAEALWERQRHREWWRSENVPFFPDEEPPIDQTRYWYLLAEEAGGWHEHVARGR